MTALPDFLLARIAEEEMLARSAAADDPVWRDSNEETSDGENVYFTVEGRSAIDYLFSLGCSPDDMARAAHIARWDPARVLAECEAKRRIVLRCSEMQTAAVPMTVRLAGHTLADLAMPYADHPHYRPEWRP